jgi:hypothetical protein
MHKVLKIYFKQYLIEILDVFLCRVRLDKAVGADRITESGATGGHSQNAVEQIELDRAG